jgi:pyrroloquinoline quinone biosynthesis protein B
MRVRLLGTAAGGGFPQWNCNCTNCRGVRAGTLQARPRLQCCVTISADDVHWFLLNASPDIHQQIEAFSPLMPSPDVARGSNLAGVLLTDAEPSHTLGLLLLREGLHQTIYATSAVRHALTEGLTLSPVLSHYCTVEWRKPSAKWTPLCYEDHSPSGLLYSAFPILDKPPVHLRGQQSPVASDRIGYRFIDEITGGRLVFVPAIRALTGFIMSYLTPCDALLIDGTFWYEHELRTVMSDDSIIPSMGHLPVSGPEGSLQAIMPLPIRHKIYIHINNTNPMLVEDSPEYAFVRDAGIEIGWDGLELQL